MTPARSHRTNTTYIALLRGVNVGGRSLSMAEVRRRCEELGVTDVRTYLQSGNLVLRSPWAEDRLVAALESTLTTTAGFEIPVTVRTAAELASAVEACPFDTDVDPKTLVVSFAPEVPPDPLGSLDPADYGDERWVLVGRDLFLLLPHGQGRSKLVPKLARTPFGRIATSRNWRTVLALRSMADRTEAA